MKRGILPSLFAAALLMGLTAGLASATCTATGFYKDGINLTAAVIATGDVSGQTIDATGCNIGIFYGPGASATVDSVDVSGANYFGILVAGDIVDSSDHSVSPGATSVDVTNSTITNIGENPFNGSQHGVAIYYHAFATGSSATGTISGNTASKYQKGGIVVNGPGSSASVSGNTVTGQGPVDYIAQNGIQIGFGAAGQIMRNTVTGNSYTGQNDASSAGVLIYGGCDYPMVTGVQIVKNAIGSTIAADGNDIGVALVNFDPITCAFPPSMATNNKAINNTITDDESTNASGNGYPDGYQAGILDIGVNDKLIDNNISGSGYTGSCTASGTVTCPIDTSSSSAAKVRANAVP